MGIQLSNIGKVRARKRLLMCYHGAEIDFIKGRLEVANGSREVILHVVEVGIGHLREKKYY